MGSRLIGLQQVPFGGSSACPFGSGDDFAESGGTAVVVAGWFFGEVAMAPESASTWSSCARSAKISASSRNASFHPYGKHGYGIVGRVEDFPSGSDALWYRRRLRSTGFAACAE
jgi:hypothetical protein